MRNLPPTLRGDKFYTSGLTLCGERVLLTEPDNRRRARFANKNLNLMVLDGALAERYTFFRQNKAKSPTRVQIPVKIHTTDYKNPEVCSKELKQVLPEDPTARRVFVTSGALKRVQEIEVKPGTTLMDYINTINACFPEEIVHFYSPGYSDSLLEKVEQYSPQLMTVLRESQHENVDIQTDLTAVLDDTSECDQNLDAIDCHT